MMFRSAEETRVGPERDAARRGDTSDRQDGATIVVSDMSVEYAGATGRGRRAIGATLALEDVSFTVQPGEFVAIVGPSGCGKSTLLKVVSGLLEPSRGSYTVTQQGVDEPRVGFVFQSDALLPWLTGLDNVELATRLAGKHAHGEAEPAHDRARELMRELGLEDCCDMYPGQLSGGMRKRVALARALAYRPAVFLMDEPFGPLDAITRGHVGNFFLKVLEDARQTTLFVTHDIDEAVALADRVMVLSRRPGRHVATIDVPMPRPREYHGSRFTDGFQEIRGKVADALSAGG